MKKQDTKLQIDKDEREYLEFLKKVEDMVEKGTLRLEGLSDEQRMYWREIAKNTKGKTKVISLRVNELDLLRAKDKAARLGLPYQTWITSLIHQNLD